MALIQTVKSLDKDSYCKMVDEAIDAVDEAWSGDKDGSEFYLDMPYRNLRKLFGKPVCSYSHYTGQRACVELSITWLLKFGHHDVMLIRPSITVESDGKDLFLTNVKRKLKSSHFNVFIFTDSWETVREFRKVFEDEKGDYFKLLISNVS